MAVLQSLGLTITFLTSAFSAEITDVSGDGMERDEIDTSHLGTAAVPAGSVGNMTSVPAKLVNPGGVTLELHYNPDNLPPLREDPETVRITFPVPAGMATGAKLEGSGYLTGWSFKAPLNGKMVATAKLKWAGPVARTAAA